MSNDEIQIETKGGTVLVRVKWAWAVLAVAALQGMLLTGLYLALDRHNDERYIQRSEYAADQRYMANERSVERAANQLSFSELKSTVNEVNRNIIALMQRK